MAETHASTSMSRAFAAFQAGPDRGGVLARVWAGHRTAITRTVAVVLFLGVFCGSCQRFWRRLVRGHRLRPATGQSAQQPEFHGGQKTAPAAERGRHGTRFIAAVDHAIAALGIAARATEK